MLNLSHSAIAGQPLSLLVRPQPSFPVPSSFSLQSPFGGTSIPADPDTSTTSSSSGSGTPLGTTPYANAKCQPTAQMASPKWPIEVELANKELWEKFSKVGNEMVVTRPGRKMFPKLELRLHGLDPKANYTLLMCMQKMDNFRYKYQAGGWSAAGQDDQGNPRSNTVQHHEGWNSGEFWSGQERISFERVKLTNKEIQQGGNSLISLCSMQKYQPIILLCQNTAGGTAMVKEFRPAQCQFIAVTAYQSEAVTKLKVEHNPFAKGFREGSTRKRALSPDAAGPVSFDPALLAQCHPLAKRVSVPAQYTASAFQPLHPFTAHPSPWLSSPSAQLAVAMASMAASSAAIPSAAANNPGLDALAFYNNLYQQMFLAGGGQAQKEVEDQGTTTPKSA